MDLSNYITITFLSTKFDFIHQKLNAYSLVFIGTDLSKSVLEKELKSFDSNREIKILANALEKNNVISIGLLKNENILNFNKELQLIEQKIDLKKSHFLVLLDHELPTTYRSTEYRPSEESFLISSDKFTQFYKEKITTGLCYHLMLGALNHNLEQILVHQIKHPNPLINKAVHPIENAEVIIPHRGNLEDLADLETALWYLEQQQVKPRKISVCFDEFVSEHHFKIVDEHNEARFFVNFPSGVGPYPSRDALARTTEEEVIIFHDSDDISTINRIGILTDVLKNDKWDAVGSHELRVNKIEKRIEAIRFPLDVIEVQNKQNAHAIFFPTTAIKKTAYLKTGGLSTIRKHSSDSQFYRRAHFFLNIKNVDEFLYIRIKRENSLTTASSTALGTTVRLRLNQQWKTDFLKIQNRNISLLESTLFDEYNVAEIDLVPLEEKYRETILNWQELKLRLQKSHPSNQLKPPSFPNEKDILESRILDYRLIKDPGIAELKKSLSWRIGWKITRVIIFLFGWIPFVRKRL
jgi:hypothetical protein